MKYKKSNLLAYWIHNYTVYHDEKKDFDTTKIRIFKRGDIVKQILDLILVVNLVDYIIVSF